MARLWQLEALDQSQSTPSRLPERCLWPLVANRGPLCIDTVRLRSPHVRRERVPHHNIDSTIFHLRSRYRYASLKLQQT